MRRVLVAASLVLALVVTAAPVAAAETYQFRGEGNWARALFSNVPNGEETIPPGTYFYTEVFGSSQITTFEGETFEDGGVCVFHVAFTIDADGNWTGETYFGNCFAGDVNVARRLSGGSIVGTFPLEECLVWNEETKECLEIEIVGSIDVDLALTGVGPTYRYHGVSSGGTAGFGQYTQHGTGSFREATATGAVILSADGSVTDLTGGVSGFGSLQQSRDGYVQVMIHG